jgi:polar amino acid transport system substrate-binding protein
MAASKARKTWWAACFVAVFGLTTQPLGAQDKSVNHVQPLGAQDRPVVRVAMEGAYPPFNYLEGDELQGFEVDLVKALCEAMRASCTLVTHEWDGIIRGLLNHDYDAIMSSLEVTERRKKRIAFSRRYYRIPAAVIARKDTELPAVTPDALAGKAIGTVDRSEHAAYVENLLKKSELRTYAKLEEANLDLLTERIDFVMGDKLALWRFLESREGACCHFVADVPENPVYHGADYAVGLRKEDGALRAAFDQAIAQVITDGTYDRIRAKYFPFDIK